MYRIFTLVVVLLIGVVNADSLTEDSYQNVKIGMSVKEARLILKNHVDNLESMDDSSCYYLLLPAEYKAISYMIEDGKVVRIDNYDSLHTSTKKGIKIGSSKKDVLNSYEKVKVSVHPYNDLYGEYLEVRLNNGNGIIFETNRDSVTSFRLGSYPSVGYIEGCF